MLLWYLSVDGLSTDSLRVGSHMSFSGDKALLDLERAEISSSLPCPVAQHVLANIHFLLNSAGWFLFFYVGFDLEKSFWFCFLLCCLVLLMGNSRKKQIMFLFLFTGKNVTVLIVCSNFSFFIFYVLKFYISKAGSLSFSTLKCAFLIAFHFNVKEWNWGGKNNLSWRKCSVI